MGPGPAVSGQEFWLSTTSVPKDVPLPEEGEVSAEALQAQSQEMLGVLTSGSVPQREG